MITDINKLLILTLAAVFILSGASAEIRPDSTFNRFGYNILTGSRNNQVDGRKAVITGDGSILVAGFRGSMDDSLTLFKLLPDGALDISFGQAGYSSIYASGFQVSQGNMDMILQRDGKIVVLAVGQKLTVPVHNTQLSIILARFNSDGSSDQSFGSNGILIHRPHNDYQFTPLAIAIDSTEATDKFYVSSLATENGNAGCPLGFGKWAICKYHSNGTLDQSFNGTGYTIQSSATIRNAPTQTPLALVLALKVLPSGKLLAGGAYAGVDSAYFMFRMNANGSWDHSFADAGRATLPWHSAGIGHYQTTSAHILKDESVVFATASDIYTNGTYDSSVLYASKLNSDGSAATSFGMNGTLTTHYKGEGHHQISTDNSNRLLLSWKTATGTTQYMHFRCFTSNGRADELFAPGGHTSIEPITRDNSLYATTYDAIWSPDNKGIVVLERRYNAAYANHVGVFKYRLMAKEPVPTAVAAVAEIAASVYPQPAKDILILKLSGMRNASVYLFNNQGQAVWQSSVASGTSSIDVGSFARGVYFLHIVDESGSRHTQKVILE